MVLSKRESLIKMDKKKLLNIVFFVGILAVAIGLRVLF